MIAESAPIEDVQQSKPTGTPVSSDYLGTINTIEGVMDAIGSVLNYVEVVGRGLSKNEIVAFGWIEDAYNMPIYEQQLERLPQKRADVFLEMATEFEELLYPSSAENPQKIIPLRLRKKMDAEKKRAKAEAKRKAKQEAAEAKRKAKQEAIEKAESMYAPMFTPDSYTVSV